jgi:phosphoglycerate dehydrogenase-like enzyme
LLDDKFFKAMKNSALLVSVGRGATTNTGDLLVALQAGELRGAALDVTDPEPLPSDHPLWKQKNVIITPHIAGTGSGAVGRAFSLMLENVRRYQADKPLLNTVNKKAGY